MKELKEITEKTIERNNVFLILSGVILLLAGAGGGITISTFALRITEVIWQTIIGIVGVILIIIGLFLTWKDTKVDKATYIEKNKLNKSSESQVQKEKKDIQSDHLKIEWPIGEPITKYLLRDAKYSLLLLGTSLSRAMHADFFLYHDWLEADSDRMLGFLFLNPNSPHASSRGRSNVMRSSSNEIARSLEIAFNAKKQHANFLIAIYDGPSRYSASAVDIGKGGDACESTINVVTSSHSGGTSKGFSVSLSSRKSIAAYEFYESDLMYLWKVALANLSGHGISMVFRSDNEFDSSILKSAMNQFVDEFGKESHSFHAYPSEQLHVTVSSICRTQSQPFLPPLRIGAPTSEINLPIHFGEFLKDLIQAASIVVPQGTSLVFDQLTLDETGQVRLQSREHVKNEFDRTANNFRKGQSELVRKYARQYPEEAWDEKNRFDPRYPTFLPHVTIGVAFDHAHGLPTRLEGKNHSMGLSKPIRFVCGDLLIAHYAYRSLLRCMGEFEVSRAENLHASSETILRKLGIDPELQERYSGQ